MLNQLLAELVLLVVIGDGGTGNGAGDVRLVARFLEELILELDAETAVQLLPGEAGEILAVAEKHNLAVIEDAAHSPEASLEGRALGCFSFFSNKNLSAGKGGMIVTERDDLAEKIRLMRSHGMTTLTYDRHKGHAYTYDVVALCYNYRIDEIRSALGLEQLKKLPANNARRGELVAIYREALAGMGLEVPFSQTPPQPAYHLMPVLLPQGTGRKAVIDRMRERQIQTSIHYPPTHTFTYYLKRYGPVSLPKTENLAARELTLPLYPTMGTEAAQAVIEALKLLWVRFCLSRNPGRLYMRPGFLFN